MQTVYKRKTVPDLRQVLHDIKSPITAIAIILDMLQPGQILEEMDYKVLIQALEEVKRVLE